MDIFTWDFTHGFNSYSLKDFTLTSLILCTYNF